MVPPRFRYEARRCFIIDHKITISFLLILRNVQMVDTQRHSTVSSSLNRKGQI